MTVAERRLLTETIELAGRQASSRVVFGPHETNLGDDRALGSRHAAYYAARAAGGAGIIITETASVHPSDWPYERAPRADGCGPGWQAIVAACRQEGALVVASLGHAGAQGSSAYSQMALWAPSPVADVVNREMPMVMEQAEVDQLVEGFHTSAVVARQADLDGVEIDIGPYSLLRQFHSGLTNQRSDRYGEDRLLLTRQVIGAVRDALGDDRIVALRFCADELAPWAGITPEMAAEALASLAPLVDMVTVVRGGPYSTSSYRPDAHTGANFNRELCESMRSAVGGATLVALQGSVVSVADAQDALDGGVCDLVEMTRAQIADPRLVARVRENQAERIRPCVRCNQACRVRDNRNPIVSCIGEPRSGHETTEDEPEEGAPRTRRPVRIVGSGVAGLECARVLALMGHTVEVLEAAPVPGGTLRRAARGHGRENLGALVDWLLDECGRLGVTIRCGVTATADDLGGDVILATGSRPQPHRHPNDGTVAVVDALSVLDGDELPVGPVLVHDPVGGPVGIGIAEWLAEEGIEVALAAPDPIAGTLLSLTGDLADANTRLQQAGVKRELRVRLRELADGQALLEDVWTAERRRIPVATVVDASHREPEETLYLTRPGTTRIGDCVAPRSALEAVLEGRRAAMAVEA